MTRVEILHPVDLAVAHRVEQRLALGLTFLDIFAGSRVRRQDLDRGDAALAVGARYQALRDDIAKRLRQTRADDPFLVLRIKADDTVDRFRRVDRVQRREHKVARFGGFEGDLGRFKVTHFADEDNLWRLAKSGAQGGGEILCIGADLALVDGGFFVRVQKLDRVLDRDDVIGLCLVYMVDDRGERRAFSRTGRAGKQDDAVADVRRYWQAAAAV